MGDKNKYVCGVHPMLHSWITFLWFSEKNLRIDFKFYAKPWLVVLLIQLQCIFYWNEFQWTYRVHCIIYSAMESTKIAFNENCKNYSIFHNKKSMSYRSFLWRFFLYESPRVFLFLCPRVIRQDPPLRQRAVKLLKRVDFVVRRQASGWVWSMEESRWLVFGTAFWHRM